jgi:hypothetical protein
LWFCFGVRVRLNKGQRFEVFRRDSFTCRYCGRTPPVVVLEVDHFAPVSRGGDDDQNNLVTSCSDCNSGKRDSIVAPHPHIRPDVDVELLAVAQEVAESRRFLQARQERNELEEAVVAALGEEWTNRLPQRYPVPEQRITRNWLAQFTPDEVMEAIRRTGPYGEGGYLDQSRATNYVTGILKRVHAGWNGQHTTARQDKTTQG